MRALAKGQPKGLKFLSTHPQNEQREKALESYIPEVWMWVCSVDVGD
jgi:hypothetical protein